MENLSFFQADLETKELGCFGEAGCKALKGSLNMCNKSSVISEEEVSDQLLLGLCVGLKSPEIEEVAIEAIADINAIIVIEVFSSLSQLSCLHATAATPRATASTGRQNLVRVADAFITIGDLGLVYLCM